MIESIRNQMQKKGSKFILWLMVFGFAGSSLIGLISFSGRFRKSSVATVNGDQEIDVKEFQRQYMGIAEQIKYIRKMVGPGADNFLKQFGFTKNPEQLALDALVSQKAEQSAARRLGTRVSKEYLQAKFKDPFFIKEFLSDLIPPQAIKGSSIDVGALKSALRAQGITEAEFEEILTAAMERMLLNRLIVGAEYVPAAVIKEAYETDYLKKKYGIATLALEDYIKKAEAKKPTEEALKAFFEANKENYRIPEKRSARVWTFEPESYGMAVQEKDLRDAYAKRKKIFVDKPEEYEIQHIVLKFTEATKNEVRARGQELVKEIKEKPDSFAQLADKYSQAKEKSGTVVVKKGEKGSAFEQHVVNRLAPGEVSPVIETPDGYEIVKLIAKKEQTYKPFDDVKAQLAKSLKQEKFDSEFNAAAQRVVKQSLDIPTAFAAFVKDKHGKESMVGDLENDRTQRMQKLFELKNAGDKAFVVEDGKGLIIELASIMPSFLPDFASVKDTVIKDFSKDAARKALEADTAALAALVKDKKESLEKAAATLKAAYTTTEWAKPTDGAFTKRAIPSQKVKELKNVHDVVSGVTATSGFVVELLAKEPFVEKDFNERKAALRTEIAQREDQELVRSVLDTLRKKAQVVTHVDMRQFSRSVR